MGWAGNPRRRYARRCRRCRRCLPGSPTPRAPVPDQAPLSPRAAWASATQRRASRTPSIAVSRSTTRRRPGCSFADPQARARIEQVQTRGVDLDLDGLAWARMLAAGPDDDGGARVAGPVPVDVEVAAEILHEVDLHVEVAFADGQMLGRRSGFPDRSPPGLR